MQHLKAEAEKVWIDKGCFATLKNENRPDIFTVNLKLMPRQIENYIFQLSIVIMEMPNVHCGWCLFFVWSPFNLSQIKVFNWVLKTKTIDVYILYSIRMKTRERGKKQKWCTWVSWFTKELIWNFVIWKVFCVEQF